MKTFRNAASVMSAAGVVLLAAGLPAASADLPRSLTFATASQGSSSYRTGAAVSKVVTNHTSIRMRVQPTSGSLVSLGLVAVGDVAYSTNSAPDLGFAYFGKKKGVPHYPQIRALAAVNRISGAMIVRGSSNIHTLKQAAGKRIGGEFRSQLIAKIFVEGALAAAGMSWNDFNVVPVPNFKASVQGLKEGTIDVAFTSVGSGVTREADASVRGGIRYLPTVDTSRPETVRKFRAVVPGTSPVLVKKGSTPGADSDVTVMGWGVYVVNSTHQTEEAAYAVTAALWNNFAEFKKGLHAKPFVTRKFLVQSGTPIPYHPGAIKFFKEKGIWGPEMEKVQAELIAAGKK